MACSRILFALRKIEKPDSETIAMSTPAFRENDKSQKPMALDVNWVRAQFPALKQTVNGHPAAFLDAPAGTQVPLRVIDAVRDYFENSNANTCGAFATSRRTDAMI